MGFLPPKSSCESTLVHSLSSCSSLPVRNCSCEICALPPSPKHIASNISDSDFFIIHEILIPTANIAKIGISNKYLAITHIKERTADHIITTLLNLQLHLRNLHLLVMNLLLIHRLT